MIRLRKVNPALVAGLLWNVLKDDPDMPAGMTAAQWQDFLTDGFRCLGIFSDGLLIGAFGFVDDEIHLAVQPAWHGRWDSRRTSAAALAYGHQRVPVLVAHVRADNTRTLSLVKDLGFTLRQGGDWQEWIHAA